MLQRAGPNNPPAPDTAPPRARSAWWGAEKSVLAAGANSLLPNVRQPLTFAVRTFRYFQTAHQTRLCDLAARFARALPSISLPSHSEGAGNAGRPMRPIAACATIVVERTRVSQVTPESPGIPRAMVLRLIRALLGDLCLVATVVRGTCPATLAPASERQDHTTSPSASGSPVKRAARVHRIPLRVS